MRRALLAIVPCLLWTAAVAPPACAAPVRAKAAPRAAAPAAADDDLNLANFRITFKILVQGLQESGSFIVRDASQANYVHGGETPFEVESRSGRSVEFKKHLAIVNCLPSVKPGSDIIAAECQFEISGPLAPAAPGRAPPVATFQLQTSFVVRDGRTAVLVDEPDRHVEIKIETARL